MAQKKDPRGSLKLPESVHREIAAFAGSQGLTITGVIEAAWQEYKENHGISMKITFEPEAAQVKKRVANIMLRSGA